LPVWQEAARLYKKVLDLLEEPSVPLPGYRNQLTGRLSPYRTTSPKDSSV
jgi:hypothetical protein